MTCKWHLGVAAVAEELNELRIREKEQGIEPDWVRNLPSSVILSSCIATTVSLSPPGNSRTCFALFGTSTDLVCSHWQYISIDGESTLADLLSWIMMLLGALAGSC